MTVEKLQRGLEIQDSLKTIESQLKKLAKDDVIMLGEFVHPCTRKIEGDELMQLNEKATAYAMSLLNTKVKELQKEFSKL